MAESVIKARLGEGGRLVIPAALRRRMGLRVGDEVVLLAEGAGLRVLPAAAAVREAQEAVGRYLGQGRKLSEELLSERRDEVARGR